MPTLAEKGVKLWFLFILLATFHTRHKNLKQHGIKLTALRYILGICQRRLVLSWC